MTGGVSVLPSLAEIQGHGAAVALLRRLRAVHRLGHAFVFDGPVGCGRRSLALALAQELLCLQPLAHDWACGQCDACQALASGVHPDCVLLPDDRESSEIPVEMIREQIVAPASETPLWGQHRVFIIPAVERLRPQAANALLKVLEEPPPGAYVFMTTAVGDGLLPTIRSRSQRVRLQPLSQEALVAILQAQGLSSEQAQRTAQHAQGSLRLAQAQQPAVPVEALSAVIGNGYAAAEIAALFAQLDSASEHFPGASKAACQRAALRHWLTATVDHLRTTLRHQQTRETLQKIALVLQARRDLAVNIQPRLVLEGLALG